MAIRTLSQGISGQDVKAIQEALNVWGANPRLETITGVFGPKTDTAVRRFQEAHGLDPDGVVGRNTRAALFPVGVATTTIFGMRLRMPELPPFRGGSSPLSPGPLTLSPSPSGQVLGSLRSNLFQPIRFPRLATYLHAPRVPELTLTVPSLSGSSRPPQLFGFVYDHAELQPGAQSTFPFGGSRQDVFVLTMQNIYRRGPDDAAHTEAALGVQIGAPFSSPNGPWTVNPFVQLTDVDRFGSLGAFHWWQPYAQVGFQFSGLGNPQPTLTGSLFPVNLGLDVGELLTVSFAGGLALNLDLRSGQVQAGTQFSAGLTLKLGKPNSPLW